MFLPLHLRAHLAPPAPRSAFLVSLSSGQLLCVTYNACVRKSRRVWGFVSWDMVHDAITLECAAAAAAASISSSCSSTSVNALDERPHTPTPPQQAGDREDVDVQAHG